MKIGCCTCGYTDYMSLSASVEEIGKKGFDFVEINTDGNIAAGEKKLIEQHCEKYGMFLHLHVNLNAIYAGSYLKKRKFGDYFAGRLLEIKKWKNNNILRQLSFDPLYGLLMKREIAKKKLPAGQMGAKIKRLRVVEKIAGAVLGKVKYGKFQKGLTVEALKIALKYNDTEVCIENLACGTTSYSQIADIRSFLKRKEKFAMLVDVGHLNLRGKDVCEYIKGFPFKIGGFHLSNNDGGSDSHSTLSEGKVNYMKVINVIRKINCDPALALEIVSPSLDEHRRNIDDCREFLEEACNA